MKRVKGVEDLNICLIGAQGIVGVGATILMSTAWSPVAAYRTTAVIGFQRATATWFLTVRWPISRAAN